MFRSCISGFLGCAIRMTGDQRIHHHLGDRRADRAVLRGETLHQRERAERDEVRQNPVDGLVTALIDVTCFIQ